MIDSIYKGKFGKEVEALPAILDLRASNLAGDLSTSEKDGIKTKLDITPGGGGDSSAIEGGAFTGEFNVSDSSHRLYDDYTTGAVVNLTVSATKVLGSQARVRIKGDLIGIIPADWNKSGDPISKNPAYLNELTFMYVRTGDLNLVNRTYYIDAGGFEPEYQAMLDYAIANSFEHPTATQKEIDNLKVRQLKQTGIWYEMDKVHIFNSTYAPTSWAVNFYRINWKNPNAFLLTADVGKEPTWVSGSGFKVTGGSGAFAKTGFRPFTHGVAMSVNNASETWAMFDAPTTFQSDGFYWAGGRNSGSSITSVLMGNNANNAFLTRLHAEAAMTITQSELNSHFQICRETNLIKGYQNRLVELPLIGTVNYYSAMTDFEQYLFGFNTAGTATTSAVTHGLKYYLSGSSLRAQRLDLYQILNETY